MLFKMTMTIIKIIIKFNTVTIVNIDVYNLGIFTWPATLKIKKKPMFITNPPKAIIVAN